MTKSATTNQETQSAPGSPHSPADIGPQKPRPGDRQSQKQPRSTPATATPSRDATPVPNVGTKVTQQPTPPRPHHQRAARRRHRQSATRPAPANAGHRDETPEIRHPQNHTDHRKTNHIPRPRVADPAKRITTPKSARTERSCPLSSGKEGW